MKIPTELKGNELLKFLVENKQDIIYSKKSAIKFSDPIGLTTTVLTSTIANKAEQNEDGSIKVRAIINTTNVVDSHKDLHVNGIWDKSLSENRNIKFLQEHQMKFDKIIADKEDLSVKASKLTWKSLGFDMEGSTEALVFDATIKEERNSYMYNQYKNLNVDNHSVGMQYVKILLAINSEEEDYEEEKKVWDKYYERIANKEDLANEKYFWVVTEAKVIEGSAVVLGSNRFTPTLNNKNKDFTYSEKDKAILKWLEIEE